MHRDVLRVSDKPRRVLLSAGKLMPHMTFLGNPANGFTFEERANWPIQEHWNRLITLGAAWSGVNPAVSSTWAKDPKLLAAVQKGLDYWFSNDYTPADCMGDGGNA